MATALSGLAAVPAHPPIPKAATPGGRCRKGASTKARITFRPPIRELREETGIRSIEVLAETKDWIKYELPEPLQGKSWSGKYRGQKQKWVAVRFTGDDSEINLTPEPGHKVEFEAWKWVPISEVTDRVVSFKREVYEAVVKEFAGLASKI